MSTVQPLVLTVGTTDSLLMYCLQVIVALPRARELWGLHGLLLFCFHSQYFFKSTMCSYYIYSKMMFCNPQTICKSAQPCHLSWPRSFSLLLFFFIPLFLSLTISHYLPVIFFVSPSPSLYHPPHYEISPTSLYTFPSGISDPVGVQLAGWGQRVLSRWGLAPGEPAVRGGDQCCPVRSGWGPHHPPWAAGEPVCQPGSCLLPDGEREW